MGSESGEGMLAGCLLGIDAKLRRIGRERELTPVPVCLSYSGEKCWGFGLTVDRVWSGFAKGRRSEVYDLRFEVRCGIE